MTGCTKGLTVPLRRDTSAMDIDADKIDGAVVALLDLTLRNGYPAWKAHDWDALDRLH